MATARKTAQGTWRIEVEHLGQRKSKTLPTKREAQDWAAQTLMFLKAEQQGMMGEVKTLADAFRRYAQEVSPSKRGEVWELKRLSVFTTPAHGLPVELPLSKLRQEHFADWRDRRLRIVGAGTMLRDMTLMRCVLEAARRDWGWLPTNPMQEIRKPKQPAHRERLVSMLEVRKMIRALGYAKQVRSVSNAVAHAALIALFTGMRAGEICALQWADVRADYVILHTSKNGKGRQVPLTKAARRVIEQLKGWDDASVTGLETRTLDALYRKARGRAGLSGFTFHDLRHTAATRLAQKLHAPDLARMFGWQNLNQVMAYYNASASDIAKRLG